MGPTCQAGATLSGVGGKPSHERQWVSVKPLGCLWHSGKLKETPDAFYVKSITLPSQHSHLLKLISPMKTGKVAGRHYSFCSRIGNYPTRTGLAEPGLQATSPGRPFTGSLCAASPSCPNHPREQPWPPSGPFSRLKEQGLGAQKLAADSKRGLWLWPHSHLPGGRRGSQL